MPPTILSSGKANMNQPYVFGQSGTDSPEPVLVTRPPAKIRSAVDAATRHAKKWRLVAGCRLPVASGDIAYLLVNVNSAVAVAFSPTTTDWVCAPSVSCHASTV